MISFGGHLNPTDSAMIGIKKITFAGVSVGNIAVQCASVYTNGQVQRKDLLSNKKYKTQNTL